MIPHFSRLIFSRKVPIWMLLTTCQDLRRLSTCLFGTPSSQDFAAKQYTDKSELGNKFSFISQTMV